MRFVLAICLLAVIKKTEERKRIIGGAVAPPGKFPWIVALFEKQPFRFICGGSLVRLNVVLSAAHCFAPPNASLYFIMGGDVNLHTPTTDTRQDHDIREVIIHPLFDSTNMDYDFAVLELTEEVTPNPNFKVVKMAGRRPRNRAICFVAGWGVRNETDQEESEELMFVGVMLQPYRICRKMPFFFSRTSMLCAGFLGGGKDSCIGNSGGPLTCYGKLTGIVSFGQGCARKGLLGVYSNLPSALSWIQDVIGTNYYGFHGPGYRAGQTLFAASYAVKMGIAYFYCILYRFENLCTVVL